MSRAKICFRLAAIVISAIISVLILTASALAATVSVKRGWVALDSQNRVVLDGVQYSLSGTSGVRPIKKITNGVSTIDVKNNSVIYLSNNKPGKAQALIIGSTISGYKDAFITQFTVVNGTSSTVKSNGSGSYQLLKPIAISSLKISVSNATYTGKSVIPKVTIKNGTYILKQGTDYTLTCKNNTKVGSKTASVTITGKGRYKSSVTRKFSIGKGSIANAAISNIKKSYSKNKGAVKPAVGVTVSGVKLVKDKDYTVSYKNNNKPGTAKIILKGKGKYKGSKTVSFKIFGKIDKSCVDTVGICNYTGKAVKPTPKVTCFGKTLKNGRDYTLSYQNNIKVGTASLTITGKNNYKGEVTVTFNISKMTAGEYLARCAGLFCYSKGVWGGYNKSYDKNTNRKIWKKLVESIPTNTHSKWYHSCTINLLTTIRWSGYDNAKSLRAHLNPSMVKHLKTSKKWEYKGKHNFKNAQEANKFLEPGDILWHGDTGTGHTLMYVGPKMAKTIYNDYIKGTDGDKGAPSSDQIWISAHGGYKGTCQLCLLGRESLAYAQSYCVTRPVGSLNNLDKTFAKVLPSLRPKIK